MTGNSFTEILCEEKRFNRFVRYADTGGVETDRPYDAASCGLDGAMFLLLKNRPELKKRAAEIALYNAAYAVAKRRGDQHLNQAAERGLGDLSLHASFDAVVEICREADRQLELPVVDPIDKWGRPSFSHYWKA